MHVKTKICQCKNMATPIFCITSYSRRNTTEIWNCIELQQKRSCKWCKTTCLSWWQHNSLEEDWKKSWCSMNRAHYWHTTYTKYFLAGMCKGHLQKTEIINSTALIAKSIVSNRTLFIPQELSWYQYAFSVYATLPTNCKQTFCDEG